MKKMFPIKTIKRLMKEKTCLRIGQNATEKVHEFLTKYLEAITLRAEKNAKINGRNTIYEQDIEF